MKWLLEKLAGSKAGETYKNLILVLEGKKTHLAGLAMVLRGAVALIDQAHGTSLGDILEILRSPAMDEINQGLALMALRAGISASSQAKPTA